MENRQKANHTNILVRNLGLHNFLAFEFGQTVRAAGFRVDLTDNYQLLIDLLHFVC
jgi:hypothetical protein